ncbi:Unannotated [Lentimonas sp. CC19]|nr:Unannotated [Lentimonas sp. CC19]CAA6696682.1 Unannotated [Lentimonas sp. CC10]CAA7072438.1 Unannotated [Lentimonas sp. CC11]
MVEKTQSYFSRMWLPLGGHPLGGVVPTDVSVEHLHWEEFMSD